VDYNFFRLFVQKKNTYIALDFNAHSEIILKHLTLIEGTPIYSKFRSPLFLPLTTHPDYQDRML